MTISFTDPSLPGQLQEGQVQTRRLQGGVRIRVNSGLVWLTIAGCREDIWLEGRGAARRSRRSGRVPADSRLSIHSLARGAATIRYVLQAPAARPDPLVLIRAKRISLHWRACKLHCPPPAHPWLAPAAADRPARRRALRGQLRRHARLYRCAHPDSADQLWIVEHPPVYTLGLGADRAHVLNPHDIPWCRPTAAARSPTTAPARW
jgi:hypothetical protein